MGVGVLGTAAFSSKPSGEDSLKPGASSSAALLGGKKVPPVKIELFVMSQCPYGIQAEAAFKDVVGKLGSDVDFSLDYIGTVSDSGEPSSMHGPKEVAGDTAQLCAAKLAPTKYLDLIACQNKDPTAVDANWESCATEVGIALGPLQSCARGDDGKKLLTASFARSTERDAKGSPTIFIGGKPYGGNRKVPDILRTVCEAYGDEKPAFCLSLPAVRSLSVVNSL